MSLFAFRYLHISDIQEEDTGQYTCIATNAAGMIEHDITVEVLVPPYLSRKTPSLGQGE